MIRQKDARHPKNVVNGRLDCELQPMQAGRMFVGRNFGRDGRNAACLETKNSNRESAPIVEQCVNKRGKKTFIRSLGDHPARTAACYTVVRPLMPPKVSATGKQHLSIHKVCKVCL